MPNSLEGRINAAFGRHYEVETSDNTCLTAFPRGKKSVYVCGDLVALAPGEPGQARILRHLPRTSLLYRSDAYREKLIAANATQAVLVVATVPSFSVELLTRALIAAESQGLRSVIVLNKCDFVDLVPAARTLLAPVTGLGYDVVELSARNDATPLLPYLAEELSVLVGQSGMGKSTLVNALVAGADTRVGEISTRLDSGKHTTTYTRLYRLQDGGALIDSPGLQEFGLGHLSQGHIEQGFVEFRPHLGCCRFRDCHHRLEPDCAIKRAVATGEIANIRYEHYLRLTDGG